MISNLQLIILNSLKYSNNIFQKYINRYLLIIYYFAYLNGLTNYLFEISTFGTMFPSYSADLAGFDPLTGASLSVFLGNRID